MQHHPHTRLRTTIPLQLLNLDHEFQVDEHSRCMKKTTSWRGFSAYRFWSQLPSLEVSHLPDVIMFGAGIALFYGVVTVGRSWLGPFTPTVEISRSLSALPAYAGYSLLRITIAYSMSFAFTLVYGYVAAYSP